MNKNENKNESSRSHITDHLANERTYLAWMRTSLGIMAFGFVIERFSLFTFQIAASLEALNIPHSKFPTNIHLPERSSAFGFFLILTGIFMAVLAYYKYKRVKKQIEAEIDSAPNSLLEATLLWLIVILGLCLILLVAT